MEWSEVHAKYKYYIKYLAKKFQKEDNALLDKEDLNSEGSIGLWNGYLKYKEKPKSIKNLDTYLKRCIVNQIRQAIEKQTTGIKGTTKVVSLQEPVGDDERVVQDLLISPEMLSELDLENHFDELKSFFEEKEFVIIKQLTTPTNDYQEIFNRIYQERMDRYILGRLKTPPGTNITNISLAEYLNTTIEDIKLIQEKIKNKLSLYVFKKNWYLFKNFTNLDKTIFRSLFAGLEKSVILFITKIDNNTLQYKINLFYKQFGTVLPSKLLKSILWR